MIITLSEKHHMSRYTKLFLFHYIRGSVSTVPREDIRREHDGKHQLERGVGG